MKNKTLVFGLILSMSMLAGCSLDEPTYSVSLDKNQIELIKNGSGVQLVASVTSNKTQYDNSIIWTVENPAVASVDNGYVLGIGEGTTNVYAYAKADTNVFAKCSVSVLDNYVVNNVILSPSSFTLDLGGKKTENLTAQVIGTPGISQAVQWSTNPEGIVTVSETGLVTALSAGSAVITAKSCADLSKYGQANVKVLPVEKEVTQVTVSPSDVTLDISGTKTQQLTATVAGSPGVSQDVTYSTNDSAIATVSSNGLITAIKKGVAKITVASVVDTSKFAFVSVNVIDSAPGQLVINPSSASLDVYNNKTLNLTVENGSGSAPSVTWSINDSTLATVTTTGKVTAKKAGSAVITATLKSDSSITANCVITITDSTPKVTKVTLSQHELALDVYNKHTATLTAEVEGVYNPSKTVTWLSSNTSVATVSNGVVTAKAVGTATITAKSSVTTSVSDTCTVTVTDSAPIEVTLSKTSANIGISKTLQLSATVSHYSSDNSVTWSSSKSSVATVDSTGKVTGVSTGLATITATSKEDSTKSATCQLTVSEVVQDKWTIMIYICGADLESSKEYGSISGLATGDIKEILSVSGQPDDVNIVIQTGGAKEWATTYGISSSYNQRWHVENKKLVKDVDKVYSSYNSMGQSSTLKDFLVWGFETYPADKVGLILWNHGGAMQGVCYDEKKSDDSLLNSEVKSALSSAFSDTSRSENLEFIGYDACLMQVQDIAEFNSQYANYMIGSEESESGYGWDYDNWVDDLYADKSTTVILKAICDSFIQENGGTSSKSNDQTLSYLDLSKAQEYKTAWENLSTQLYNKLSSSSTSKSSFTSWIRSNIKHYAEDDFYGFGTFDAKDFLTKLSSNSTYNPGSTYITEAMTAHTNLVKYSTCGKGAGNSYGLAMFFAIDSSYTYTYKEVYNSSETNFANWVKLNKDFGYLQ